MDALLARRRESAEGGAGSMRHLLLIPALLSLYSLLLYAFIGDTTWAPVGPGDGGRSLLLYFVHAGGLFCALAWVIAGSEDE